MKNNYRQIKLLSKTDAAHVAGLIDGEGTVTLTRKHKNENRQLCISIASTEINLLDFVLTATGVGKITNKRARNTRMTYLPVKSYLNKPFSPFAQFHDLNAPPHRL